ncbi:lipopolysaccharide biosynthesis protein [Pseudocolwellia agarivorans]|uniref:lipopolysaccharide biosynthesis protein n=1 Tax=Pseudocolwellia agarivorans TaxID=1911682 RepID=UPI0009855C5C|nr:oligosaccharide flippase family protein [Pseudocolwellia agarivorans]
MNIIIKNNNLLASVSLVTICRALGAFLGFVSGVLITRYLGIKESGLYFYAIDLITTIAVFSGLGLNNALLRDVASKETDTTYIAQKFWSIIKFVFIVSFVCITIITLSSTQISQFVSKPDLKTLLLILSLLIFLLPLNSYLVTLLQGQKRLIKSSLLQFIFPYTLLSLFIILFKPSDSITTSYIHLAVIILTVTFGLFFSKKEIFTYKATQHSNIKGWPSFVTMHLFSSLSVMVISLINGYFLLPEEFAILTAANRYTLLISFCLIAFNFVAAPKYAKLYKEGKITELANFAQSITRFLILIIVPCSFVVLFFSDELMSLYGKSFDNYGYILAVLVIGQIINVATGSVGYLLTLSGHEKDLKNIIVISTPLSVLLSLILTYHLGLIGVAIAMAMSAININICAYIMVVKRLGFHTINFSIKTIKK